MNRDDVLQTLAILKAAYPSSFQVNGRAMPQQDAEAMIQLWTRQFADEDASAVRAAVENLISTRTTGFSPTVGEIKDQLHRLRTVDGINDAQAWALVEKACRRGLYNAREEFEKLPPDVQAAVGGPEQLKAWAAMDSETVNSVVASNFRKTYHTVKAREKEKAMMPPEVKAFIAGVAENMKLGDGAGGKLKEIEDGHKAAMLPARLQPMIAKPQAAETAGTPHGPHRAEYEPLSEAEWTAKRDAAMVQLRKAMNGG